MPETQPKSAQARQATLEILADLNRNPIGTGRGENFSAPSNYAVPPARIYVINHSRTKKWKKVVVPVSARRGAEEALIYDRELSKIYNVDTLTRQIENGKDMNRYKVDVWPCVFRMQCGSPLAGQPARVYAIPPARDDDSPPPRVEVVEGMWDIYLGNYARMRGFKNYAEMEKGEKAADPTIIGQEQSSLALFWSRRHNPVARFTDDGTVTDRDNPYGFLEFVRESASPVVDTMDKEWLSAFDLVET